jgi:hypothetical protein
VAWAPDSHLPRLFRRFCEKAVQSYRPTCHITLLRVGIEPGPARGGVCSLSTRPRIGVVDVTGDGE